MITQTMPRPPSNLWMVFRSEWNGWKCNWNVLRTLASHTECLLITELACRFPTADVCIFEDFYPVITLCLRYMLQSIYFCYESLLILSWSIHEKANSVLINGIFRECFLLVLSYGIISKSVYPGEVDLYIFIVKSEIKCMYFESLES